jgi:hypothetical protein
MVDRAVAGKAPKQYDVFLSHAHLDARWIEKLATQLVDEHGLKVWLDRWVLVPGEPWQRQLARALKHAASCAVCIGRNTPKGWFQNEIEKALGRQAQDASFRVIPVLLPNARARVEKTIQETFLELNTWVDFRKGADETYALHLLVSGVRGVPPGRYTPPAGGNGDRGAIVDQLRELKRLRDERLVDDPVALEFQRKILESLLDKPPASRPGASS